MIWDHKLLSISFAHLESSAPKLGQFSLHWWIMADLFRALISTVDDGSNHTSIAAEGKLKPSCGTRISPLIEGCELVSPSIDDPLLLISKGYTGNYIPKNRFFEFIRDFMLVMRCLNLQIRFTSWWTSRSKMDVGVAEHLAIEVESGDSNSATLAVLTLVRSLLGPARSCIDPSENFTSNLQPTRSSMGRAVQEPKF